MIWRLGVDSRMPGLQRHRARIERRVLVRDVRVVEKARAGELMAQIDARLLVVLVAGEARGVLAADAPKSRVSSRTLPVSSSR